MRHHKTLAKCPKDLCVRGDYFEVRIGRIDLNAIVQQYDKEKECVLVEAIYSNLWEHRISTFGNDSMFLIDSDGFQHGVEYLSEARISTSRQIQRGTELPGIANVIEGNAKTHGWIVFPKLRESVIPHRLIFKINIFYPGETSGSVRDSECLELVFDLSIFGYLLENV